MNRREAIAALTALPATVRLSAAQVAPTDVVIVECDERLRHEVILLIQEQLRQVWPGRKVLVLDKGMHIRIAPG